MRLARLLAVLLLLAACGDGDPKVPRAGDIPPPFSSVQLDGTEVKLPADTAGKVVVLRFWNTWCPACRAEMEDMEAAWRETRDDGVSVLSVNAGQSRAEVAAFLSKLTLTHAVLLDTDSAITRRYGITGLPTTLFIGRDGRIKGRVLGEADKSVLLGKIRELR